MTTKIYRFCYKRKDKNQRRQTQNNKDVKFAILEKNKKIIHM